jgi:D-alanyl-D-alanine carboxypeptidase
MSQSSYNGWPASKDRSEIGIKSFAIPDTTLHIACAQSVAPLLVNFAADFHRFVEEIDVGTLDDWSYCYRFVRGSSEKLSCHSSGTAIDLNATKHPLGKSGTFDEKKVPMIQALTKKYGLIWGGNFHNRKDEQHWEIGLDAVKVAALISKLGLDGEHTK